MSRDNPARTTWSDSTKTMSTRDDILAWVRTSNPEHARGPRPPITNVL
jgi:hypothetical protein